MITEEAILMAREVTEIKEDTTMIEVAVATLTPGKKLLLILQHNGLLIAMRLPFTYLADGRRRVTTEEEMIAEVAMAVAMTVAVATVVGAMVEVEEATVAEATVAPPAATVVEEVTVALVVVEVMVVAATVEVVVVAALVSTSWASTVTCDPTLASSRSSSTPPRCRPPASTSTR